MSKQGRLTTGILTGLIMLMPFFGWAVGPATKTSSPFSDSNLDDIIRPSLSGVIRGVDFSMSKETISTMEDGRQFINSKKVMAYQLDVKAASYHPTLKKPAEVYYGFDNKRLHRIVLFIYEDNFQTAEQMYQTMVNYLNINYGQGKVTEKGSWVWEARDDSGNDFQVTFGDINSNMNSKEPAFAVMFYLTESSKR